MAVCCWCQSPLVEAQGAWWCGGSQEHRQRQTTFATAQTNPKTKAITRWLYVPTPIQTVWHEATLIRTATRVGVGGAAGPGKSRFGRETLYWFARHVPGYHALLLRKTHKDLDQSHLRFMPHEVEQRGGSYVKGPPAMAVFKHKGEPDAIIRAGHLEADTDIENYLSSEYDTIYPDETVTFQRDPMLELFSRARTTNPWMFKLRGLDDPDPLKRLDGAFALTSTNPGGRGALWYRDFFVTKEVDREEFPKYKPDRWVFFGARLEDNPYMAAGYRETLENLPEMRRRQLLDGDWNAFEGQFFGEWRPEVHQRSMDIRGDIEHFASMDWGYNAPGVVLIWACLPDGRYHIRREYKFQGDSAETVATAVKKLVASLGIKRLRYLACDPAMWQKTGAGKGESIAETLIKRGLPARKSDNDRFNGWNRVHELLRHQVNGQSVEPWLTIAPDCKYLSRTLPAMVQDKNDPEDLDSSKDDHAVDALRYGAMSRPSPTRVVKDEQPGPGTWGFETAWAESQARAAQMVIA